MEHFHKLIFLAKKYWQGLALAALALIFLNSRSGVHSYSTRLSAIAPPSASTQSKGFGFAKEEGQNFAGAGKLEMADASTSAPGTLPTTSGWLPTANAQENTMLIRNGNINAYVDNLKSAKLSVAEKIKKQNGRIDNEDQRNEYSGLILSMTIKVAANQFQALYDDLLTISDKINSNSINVDDITKEYVDIKSRLENKKVLQARFRELAKRAGRVADVLEVERELARVSEDIDSTTKLMKQYETDVAFSTIYLYLTEPKANNGPVATPIGFLKKIGLAFKSGFDWVLDSILEFISWWPMLLVIGGAYFYWRRKKNK